MKADAKHQENDSDLRALRGYTWIGYEAWGEWAHNDTREQIPHDRRQPKLLRNKTQNQRASQRSSKSENQIDVVRHLFRIITMCEAAHMVFLELPDGSLDRMKVHGVLFR